MCSSVFKLKVYLSFLKEWTWTVEVKIQLPASHPTHHTPAHNS